MERVAESLKSKVMSAQQAAQFIKSGMVLGISGFTSVGSPKGSASWLWWNPAMQRI